MKEEENVFAENYAVLEANAYYWGGFSNNGAKQKGKRPGSVASMACVEVPALPPIVQL